MVSPKRVERLEKTLARVAREQDLDQERLRRWISFLALAGVLERAVAEGVLGSYYLKGGVAMELRFATGARATKDMDVGLDGERTDRLKRLERTLALGFDSFTFRLKAQTRKMDLADTLRVRVAVQYRSRAWQTIDGDLGPTGTGSVELVKPAIRGLTEMGLSMISPIRCLSLADQLAQKLHACTGPHSEGRARDVLDILLIDMLGKLDYAKVREVAIRVFFRSERRIRFRQRPGSHQPGTLNYKRWLSIRGILSPILSQSNRDSGLSCNRSRQPAISHIVR
ncbi:MAG: nucleotidyl transferase AbiEii/AbiGii toxin family protein [Terriglobia bacterium]